MPRESEYNPADVAKLLLKISADTEEAKAALKEMSAEQKKFSAVTEEEGVKVTREIERQNTGWGDFFDSMHSGVATVLDGMQKLAVGAVGLSASLQGPMLVGFNEFSRTSTEAKDTFGLLNHEWSIMKQTLGEAFFESIKPFTNFLESLIWSFNELSDADKEVILDIVKLVTLVGTAATAFLTLTSVLKLVASTGLLPFALAAGAVYLAFTHWDDIKSIAGGVFDYIVDTVHKPIEFLQNLIDIIIGVRTELNLLGSSKGGGIRADLDSGSSGIGGIRASVDTLNNAPENNDSSSGEFFRMPHRNPPESLPEAMFQGAEKGVNLMADWAVHDAVVDLVQKVLPEDKSIGHDSSPSDHRRFEFNPELNRLLSGPGDRTNSAGGSSGDFVGPVRVIPVGESGTTQEKVLEDQSRSLEGMNKEIEEQKSWLEKLLRFAGFEEGDYLSDKIKSISEQIDKLTSGELLNDASAVGATWLEGAANRREQDENTRQHTAHDTRATDPADDFIFAFEGGSNKYAGNNQRQTEFMTRLGETARTTFSSGISQGLLDGIETGFSNAKGIMQSIGRSLMEVLTNRLAENIVDSLAASLSDAQGNSIIDLIFRGLGALGSLGAPSAPDNSSTGGGGYGGTGGGGPTGGGSRSMTDYHFGGAIMAAAHSGMAIDEGLFLGKSKEGVLSPTGMNSLARSNLATLNSGNVDGSSATPVNYYIMANDPRSFGSLLEREPERIHQMVGDAIERNGDLRRRIRENL